MDGATLLQLAEKLLFQVKSGDPTEETERALAGYEKGVLKVSLRTDRQKKAFWINIYNAYFQILAVRNRIGKPSIYRAPLVKIAGLMLSLDEIEHGILRKYRYKPALGFLPHPFARRAIKQLAVEKMDYRIHFALNCGAVSCPPIAFYQADNIDAQLEVATRSFLKSETECHPKQKEIYVSRLMLWYLGDFGGYRGIKRMLRQKLNFATRGNKIVFKAYDWNERLQYFAANETEWRLRQRNLLV